jgi:hypothetical protein
MRIYHFGENHKNDQKISGRSLWLAFWRDSYGITCEPPRPVERAPKC